MLMKIKKYTNLTPTLISPIPIYYPHPQKIPSSISEKKKLLLGGITIFTGSIKLRFLYFKHITLNKISNKKYKELILK